MRNLVSLAVVGVLAFACRNAHAEAPVELVWRAPATCPPVSQVESEIASLVGPGAHEPLTADAVVSQSGGRFKLRLRAGSAPPRELEAADCATLARATATLLAIQLSPTAESPSSAAPEDAPAREPEATTEPPRATSREVGNAARDVPGPSPHESARPRDKVASGFGIAALAGASAGAAGRALGVELLGAYAPRSRIVRLEVFAFWSLPNRVEAFAGAGGDFTLVTGGGRACRLFGAGRVSLGPCAAVEAGVLAASGSGTSVATSASERRAWLAAAAGGLLTLNIGAVDVRMSAEVIAPFLRDRFVLDDDLQVFRPALVGVRGLFGVELPIP